MVSLQRVAGMRSPEEQEDFLERGRFGQSDQTQNHIGIDPFVWAGLLFIVAGCACWGSLALFHIGGHDSAGLPFFWGVILGIAAGVCCCLFGFVRMSDTVVGRWLKRIHAGALKTK
jgi:hypothetical protein